MRSSIGDDPSSWNCPVSQRPEKGGVPLLLFFGSRFGIGQRSCDTLVGVVYIRIQCLARLGF